MLDYNISYKTFNQDISKVCAKKETDTKICRLGAPDRQIYNLGALFWSKINDSECFHVSILHQGTADNILRC